MPKTEEEFNECNYDEIQELRKSLKSEQEFLGTISIEDEELRYSCIDTIVRISDQIEALNN